MTADGGPNNLANLSESQTETTKERLQSLLKFLREFHTLRNPIVKDVRTYRERFSFWFDELPEHRAIEKGWQEDDADYLLRVTRPSLADCPEPPDKLTRWLLVGWDDPDNNVEFEESIVLPSLEESEDDEIIFFEEDRLNFSEVLEQWNSERDKWAESERPARAADRAYRQLYRLHGRMEAERERLDLQVGDALLQWNHQGNVINHPLVLQSAELEFEPALTRITISLSSERSPELHTPLLRSIDEIAGNTLATIDSDFGAEEIGVFGNEQIDQFCRATSARIHPAGRFSSDPAATPVGTEPVVSRRQVLFTRPRVFGYSVALDAIESNLDNLEDIPVSLMSLMGVERLQDKTSALPTGYIAHHDPDLLFTKPANAEQAQIVKRLERDSAVMVQGPPGTGKTHTVANLIGHLLAQGKKILVTSHTAKALERVREEIVDEIRPLTVSAVSTDAVSRSQLEHSVNTITDRLSNSSPVALKSSGAESARRRSQILSEIEGARTKLRTILRSEYTDLTILGSTISPSDAAREISEGIGQDDWIPGSIKSFDELPLTREEVMRLYGTNSAIDSDQARQLVAELPDPDDIPTPEEFSELVNNLRELSSHDAGKENTSWVTKLGLDDAGLLRDLSVAIEKADDQLPQTGSWLVAVLDAAIRGIGFAQVWDALARNINATLELSARHANIIALHGPTIPTLRSIGETVNELRSIESHLESGRSFSLGTRLRHRSWMALLDQCSLETGDVRSIDGVKALLAEAELTKARVDLRSHWIRLVDSIGGPGISDDDDSIERTLQSSAVAITQILEWPETFWSPIEELAQTVNLPVEIETSVDSAGYPDATHHIKLVRESLPASVQAGLVYITKLEIEASLEKLDSLLTRFDSGTKRGDVVNELRMCVNSRNSAGYESAFKNLVSLVSLASFAEDRSHYLSILEKSAPDWAEAVRRREGVHGGDSPPGDPQSAWRWKVINSTLDELGSNSLDAQLTSLKRLEDELQIITRNLVSELAWTSQLENTSLSQRQSLTGWVQATKRVGRGTGKRARNLINAARRYMTESRSAVPVWIMPTSRVVESFDFSEPQFDVVILDEASQSDIMAMTVLFLAKQVVIVGDDQQVSPLSVGQNVDQEKALIEQYLTNVPNRELYDGRASIYDFGQQAFGGLVQLREHFRCVPEIISFSNNLSYNGNIVPLRQAVGVDTTPHVIDYRVEGRRSGYINQTEADFIVSAILSACELDEYANSTFGVISMLRDRQASIIDDSLRNRMDPEEFSRRRVLVGSPSQFQGDERDVMFISLVDSAENGPLRLERGDDYKKRLNVAASRARDQMWVVHSIDPSVDLKSDDLRLRLLQHVKDPGSFEVKSQAMRQKTRSELENRVGDDLLRKGYEIVPDYRVGSFFLDFAVFGKNRSNPIAIECDGDEFHTEENLEQDMARQALLERMNWTFIRLRGTDYFRDPSGTMERVFRRLQDAGVDPNWSTDEDPRESPSELKEKLLAGASRIRAVWREESGNPEVESDEPADVAETTTTGGDFKPELKMAEQPVQYRLTASNIVGGESTQPPAIPKTVRDIGDDQRSLTPYIDAVEAAKQVAVSWHPIEESETTLQLMIERIVEIEQPVHQDIVLDRVRTAYELGRLRGSTRTKVSGLLQSLVSVNHLFTRGEFFWKSGNENDFVARNKGGRQIHHISDAELSGIIEVVQNRIPEKDRSADSIMDEIRKALNIGRLTSSARERLTNLISQLINSVDDDSSSIDAHPTDNQHHFRVIDIDSLQENALITVGYDPSVDETTRVNFLKSVAIPKLTLEGVLNSLNTAIREVSNNSHVRDVEKVNLLVDWKWLNGQVG